METTIMGYIGVIYRICRALVVRILHLLKPLIREATDVLYV